MSQSPAGLPALTSQSALRLSLRHLPLGLVIPEVPEELFLIRIILAHPLKASLYPILYVPLVESQTEIEHFRVATMVVAYGSTAR